MNVVTTEADKEIGKRVKARRVAKGVSQEKLADMIGLTFQQIQKYEAGANRVSASRLAQIAKAINTPIGYFYGDAEVYPARVDSAIGEFSPREQVILLRLIHAFMAIEDTKKKSMLVALAKLMAGQQDDDEERKAA